MRQFKEVSKRLTEVIEYSNDNSKMQILKKLSSLEKTIFFNVKFSQNLDKMDEIILFSLILMPKNNHWFGLWDCSFKAWESFYRDNPAESWLVKENTDEINDVFDEIHQELLFGLMLNEFKKQKTSFIYEDEDENIAQLSLPLDKILYIKKYLKFITPFLIERVDKIELLREENGVFWAKSEVQLNKIQHNCLEKFINNHLDKKEFKLFMQM